MAERRPLVVVNGRVKELPTGDTLPGSGGSSGPGTVLSPAQLTSWVNNYNPTSWGSGVQTLRLSGNGTFHFITGLVATIGGHRVKVMNIGSTPIGFYDASMASTDVNRFEFMGQDIILLPGRTIELEYDSTSTRWRLSSAYNIWAEPAEWVNYDKAELYHRNASNISAHHLGYFGSTAVEQNSGTSGIRPRNGVITSTTGTGTTGSQGFLNNHLGRRTYTFHDGTNYVGYHVFEGAIRINQLSATGNNFIMQAGWSDQQSGAPSNGLVAQYSDNINSGNWQLRGTDNNVNTDGNSSLAVIANTWYRIRIVVYPNGTAALWINGSLITNLSSGVPGGNRDFAPYLWIRKTTGTTAATFDADYMAVGTVYSQAR